MGDLANSPRILNHALCLAKNDQKVTLFAPCKFGLPKAARKADGDLKIVPVTRSDFSFLPRGPFQFILQNTVDAFSILVTFTVRLLTNERPSLLILQNPPSTPTLLIGWLIAAINDIVLAIDWTNYGHSIMKSDDRNPVLVKFTEACETFCGQQADFNFTVSDKMAEELFEKQVGDIYVLYDQPEARFRRLESEAKSALFSKLEQEIPDLEKVKKGAKLVVTTTTWTKEDFGVLLDALTELEGKLTDEVVVVVTGKKGAGKSRYNKIIGELGFKKISIATPMLDAEDYEKMLGCADLGISLYQSVSGVDLPKSVNDMFGSGLPVLALDYPAIGELVENDKNGAVFKDALELGQQLDSYLNSEDGAEKLEKYRNHLIENRVTWEELWNVVALPELI